MLRTSRATPAAGSKNYKEIPSGALVYERLDDTGGSRLSTSSVLGTATRLITRFLYFDDFDEALLKDVSRHSASLRVSGTEQKKRVSERIIRQEASMPQFESSTGMEVLERMVNHPEKEGLLHFASAYDLRTAQVNGVSVNILQEVFIEDERLLQSCGSMPTILLFFSIFMLFFQKHYLTSFIFLHERSIRDSIAPSAIAVRDPATLYKWTESDLIPYLWSAERTLQTDAKNSANIGYFNEELLGGVMFRIRRSNSEPCTDNIISKRHYRCHNGVNSSGAYLHKDPRFGVWEKAARRLQVDHGFHTVSWTDAAIDSLRRWLPRKYSLKVGTWKHAEQAFSSNRSGNREDGMPRRKNSDRSRPTKKYSINLQGWHPHRLFRRLLDPECTWGKFQVQPQIVSERALRSNRPEFSQNRWIPYPYLDANVWEHVVAMSTPELDARKLIDRWRNDTIIDRSTLFFGVEALLRNDRIGNGIVTHIFVNFLFSRGGHIYVDIKFASLVLKDTMVVVAYAALWLISCLVNSIFTLARCWNACRQQKLWRHLTIFSNLWEWFLMLYGWFLVILFSIERYCTHDFNEKYKEYREKRKSIAVSQLRAFDRDGFDQLRRLSYFTGTMDSWVIQLVANYHVALIIRFLLATHGQQRIAVIVQTLKRATVDFIHLSFVFIIVLLTYAFAGAILFGRRHERFATTTGAVGYTVQIVFQKEFDFQSLTDQHFWTGLIWVYTLVLLACLVMVNITLAIVVECYEEYSSRIRDTSTFDAAVRVLQQLYSRRWVPNKELLLASVGWTEPRLTGQMFTDKFKDRTPNITRIQVQWLYKKAAEKVTSGALNQNRRVVEMAVASFCVYIVKLRRGLRMMAKMTAEQKRSTRRASKWEFTGSGCLRPSEYRHPSEYGFSDESHMIDSRPVADDEFVMDEAGCPLWLKEGLMPMLLQQQEDFREIGKSISLVERRLAKRGVGKGTEPMCGSRPSHPEEAKGSLKPVNPTVRHPGRARKLIDPMPRSTMPRCPAGQELVHL